METAFSQTRPTAAGCRRLTPSMLAAGEIASRFHQLDDNTQPTRVLAAFKAAAPALGIDRRLVHAIDWFFRFTQPQDWRDGSRPIVWPSATEQAMALALTLSQVKRLNRALIEAGLMIAADSPTGKRYGRRDRAGRIIVAYGFDLSPLGARYPEFLAAGQAHRERKAAYAAVRRRITIARKSLRAVAAMAVERDLPGPWGDILSERPPLGRPQPGITDAELAALARLAEAGERRAAEATEALRTALVQAEMSVEMHPEGRIDAPLQYNYKSNPDPIQDTVVALKECKHDPAEGQPAKTATPGEKKSDRTDDGRVGTITPEEVVRLAPRLKPYLATATPRWPDLVDAADWLRHELGVSKSLWGDACVAMGRERAAIALAIISIKPVSYFRTGPGGYFHAMVGRAKAGSLHLDRTIWALRQKKTVPTSVPRQATH